MSEENLHFLDESQAEKVKSVTHKFCEGDAPAEHLIARLKELLPVHKTDKETWKARVEGFDIAADMLIDRLVELGGEKEGKSFDREAVVTRARLRPLSYYHYVTGSREPAQNVMKREDYFNDPTTALVKLEDDLMSLSRLFRNL
jgi:hypothetical protein